MRYVYRYFWHRAPLGPILAKKRIFRTFCAFAPHCWLVSQRNTKRGVWARSHTRRPGEAGGLRPARHARSAPGRHAPSPRPTARDPSVKCAVERLLRTPPHSN